VFEAEGTEVAVYVACFGHVLEGFPSVVRSSVPLPSCFEQRHPTLVHLASHNLFNLEKLLFGLSVIILAFFMLGYGGGGGAPSFVAGA